MEEIVYELECEICDVTTEVVVKEIDEKPAFCPMCGESVEV